MYKKPFIITSTCLTLLLIAGNIVVSASYTTSGEVLRELESQKRTLTEANRDLNQQLLTHTSLATLQEKAQHLGFEKPDKIITIQSPHSSVALGR